MKRSCVKNAAMKDPVLFDKNNSFYNDFKSREMNAADGYSVA
jgi:hypothetical protein